MSEAAKFILERKSEFESFIEETIRKLNGHLPLAVKDYERAFTSYTGAAYVFEKGEVRVSGLLTKSVKVVVVDAEDRVLLRGDVSATVKCTRVHARSRGFDALLYIDAHEVRIEVEGARPQSEPAAGGAGGRAHA